MSEEKREYIVPPANNRYNFTMRKRCKRADFEDCMRAVYFHQMTYTEAGERLGMSRITFKKWVVQWIVNGIQPPDYLFED